MSILDSIKNQLGIKSAAKEFYINSKVIKTQWWLSWYHEYPNLYWARLRTFSSGKADVLFQDESKSYGFDGEESAGSFIAEDEFSKFENIDEEDRKDLKIPAGIIIKEPAWKDKAAANFEYIGSY